MEERNLICIGCPLGCPVHVELEERKVVSVTGNTCPRGAEYARKEVTNPTRIVTTTVRVNGGMEAMASVKTERDIPKGKIFDCVKVLKNVEMHAPVRIGDVVAENVADTGISVIATKNVPASADC